MTNELNQLEFHYIFDDNTMHFMDAYIRNSCEKEFLNFVKYISQELHLSVSVTTEAKEQGSLVDIYNFFVSNKEFITDIATLFIALIAYLFPRKTKQEKMLSDLELIRRINEMRKEGLPIPVRTEKYLKRLLSSHKISKQKSNFFKHLSIEKRVKSLEVVGRNKDSKERELLFHIDRKDFEDYFLLTDDLEPVIDSNAVIEVISPVLKRGKYMWRGIYRKENQAHEFVMLDREFKNSVIDDGVIFQNGTELICEVEICRKLDENGDVFNSKYIINKVYDIRFGETITEMPSGKRRRIDKDLENQPSLFD